MQITATQHTPRYTGKGRKQATLLPHQPKTVLNINQNNSRLPLHVFLAKMEEAVVISAAVGILFYVVYWSLSSAPTKRAWIFG